MKLYMYFLISIGLASTSFASKEGGNGAGGWVCRNAETKEVENILFVDIFEMQDEHQLTLDPSMNLDMIENKILAISEDYYNDYVKAKAEVLARWPKFGNSELGVVNDSLWSIFPKREDCPNGNWEYEQIVNFKDNMDLLVNFNHFNGLKKIEQDAVLVHETIYLLRRRNFNDLDSVMTRKIVAHLFSTLDIDLYSELLEVSPMVSAAKKIAGLWVFSNNINGKHDRFVLYLVLNEDQSITSYTCDYDYFMQEEGCRYSNLVTGFLKKHGDFWIVPSYTKNVIYFSQKNKRLAIKYNVSKRAFYGTRWPTGFLEKTK
ncbi:MAG: hypothetical protein VX642_13590 [Bdellovibrionota bacterium]|nr:hypothetical protein [Bdellovibrionota bacterium]